MAAHIYNPSTRKAGTESTMRLSLALATLWALGHSGLQSELLFQNTKKFNPPSLQRKRNRACKKVAHLPDMHKSLINLKLGTTKIKPNWKPTNESATEQRRGYPFTPIEQSKPCTPHTQMNMYIYIYIQVLFHPSRNDVSKDVVYSCALKPLPFIVATCCISDSSYRWGLLSIIRTGFWTSSILSVLPCHC